MKQNATEHSHYSLLTRVCTYAGSVTLLSGTFFLLGAPAYAAPAYAADESVQSTQTTQVAQASATNSSPKSYGLSQLSEFRNSSVVGWGEDGFREGGTKDFDTASLTLNKQSDGKNVEGVTFTLTHLPFIDVHNTDNETLNEIKGLTVEKAEERLKGLSEEPLKFSAVTGKSGNVEFKDIPVGVYIIEEEKGDNKENKELVILPNYNVNSEQWEGRGIIAWKSTHTYHPPVWPDWGGNENTPTTAPNPDTEEGAEKTPEEGTDKETTSTSNDGDSGGNDGDTNTPFIEKLINDPNLATTGFPILGLLMFLGLFSGSAVVLYFQMKKEKAKEVK